METQQPEALIDKVKVIIGGVCSGETLGAAPITEAGKVILISPSATSPDITKAGDFVFRHSERCLCRSGI